MRRTTLRWERRERMAAAAQQRRGGCQGPEPYVCAAQERLLPLAPSPEQVQFCSGDVVALWQRLGLSALVTLAAVKTAAVAAGALTFPLWWPLLQAAGRNRALRARFRCGPGPRAGPRLPCRRGRARAAAGRS